MANRSVPTIGIGFIPVDGRASQQLQWGELAALGRSQGWSWLQELRSDPRPAGTGPGTGKRGSGLQYQIVYETSKTIWEECTTLGRLVSF